MKYIKLLSRIILGTVFIFSGFVKAVDPLGSAYKFSDYFDAFGLGFLRFSALPLGILLSAFELLLGIILILGYRRKTMVVVLFWFMLFFTSLTLILAIFNPVSDCGCFGDALILTNWQTFLKNVVLMVFVMTLYLQRKGEKDSGRPAMEWTMMASIYVGASLFSVWNYKHLPLIDFRPYDVGTVIASEMKVPEGAPVDEYETTLIYRDRETGRSTEFTIGDYPKDTTRWEFVSSDSRLVKKGFDPPIHDFALMDQDGTNLVDQILSDPGYSLLMISDDLEKADKNALIRARDWQGVEFLADDFSFYAVTSSPTEVVDALVSTLDPGYNFFTADEIMLKTIVRSNPGFMLISNGTIIGKWASRDFPSVGELNPEALELIGNAAVPMDEDAQLLIESGIYEDFSFSVLDFDTFLPALVYNAGKSGIERGVIISFILGIFVVILLSNWIVPIKT
ncbi:MAG: BT_3928 family protein [Bacteroidota bacterium]